MTAMRGRRFAALFALAACTPSVRPLAEVSAPPPIASAPPLVIGPAAAPPPSSCTKRLRVAAIVAQTQTCQVNGLGVGASAMLELPCQGPGDADADFGPGQRFEGTSDGTNLHLRSARVVEFEDGCRWKFSQEITGAPATRRLQLSYEEEIVDGDACYSPCGARGEIVVE